MLDLILAGGGLANGLLAYRLKATRPTLTLLMLDAAPSIGGIHTWSFHASDLTPSQNAWMEPLIAHHWPYYDVAFPSHQRRIHLRYCTVTAESFRTAITNRMGPDLHTNTPIATLTPTTITLQSGETLHAHAVIDGRGFRPSPHMVSRFQKFFGQEVRLATPHGLGGPILMDATVDQTEGFRFIYVLPFTPDTLLIEDTYYADTATLDLPSLRARIATYAAAKSWQIAEILREETGILPITLSGNLPAFWNEQTHGQPRSGLCGNLFHPTTGYSLPDAVRLADHVAAMPNLAAPTLHAAIHRLARALWRRGSFFRLLNRMLFLAGPPPRRFQVMRRFYTLSEGLIARFYAGQLTRADQLRLLVGRPPVPMSEAIRAMFATGR